MKILLVNKFHYLKGGSETYYFELGKLLKEYGHEVAYFSMENEKNIVTGDKEYFVKPIDLNTGSKFKALDVIYSKKNEKVMRKALENFKPDIVHLNNFQRQLSASIINPIKKKKIPILYTAHDIQAICPSILMLDPQKNICEECMHGKYINCAKKKCIKNSTLKSILGTIEGMYYKYHNLYTEKIDYIIAPSKFYMLKLIQDGVNKNKISYIHNFMDTDLYNFDTRDEGYALYFGRLSREKGIINLINAFKKNNSGLLYIAGDGPEKDNIKKIIKDNKLEKRVFLLGFLDKMELKRVISDCKFVVVPSIWYENCPYSIIEALCMGKPVIGANIGGIPELVENKVNGLIYKYDDITDLSEKMNLLFNDEKLVTQYSKNAKEKSKKEFSKESYYKKIISVYEKLLKGE